MDESINVFGEKLEICGMAPRLNLQSTNIRVLEIGTSFIGNDSEIYDCEICCNPNKLEYEVYDGEININNVGDGNE